jgi:hypothetical protein
MQTAEMMQAYSELTEALGLGPAANLIGGPHEEDSEKDTREMLEALLIRSCAYRDALDKKIINVKQQFFPD